MISLCFAPGRRASVSSSAAVTGTSFDDGIITLIDALVDRVLGGGGGVYRRLRGASSGACTAGICDGGGGGTYLDFVDALRMGDVSAAVDALAAVGDSAVFGGSGGSGVGSGLCSGSSHCGRYAGFRRRRCVGGSGSDASRIGVAILSSDDGLPASLVGSGAGGVALAELVSALVVAAFFLVSGGLFAAVAVCGVGGFTAVACDSLVAPFLGRRRSCGAVAS